MQTCLVSRLSVARIPELSGERVGTVRFGTSKAQAVAELKQRLGKPSGRFPDTGCLPRYSEVAWRDLVVEFRDGRLSGFRYLVGGWPPMNRPANHSLRTPVTPLLRTTAGITLGDTLKRVRRQEGGLQRVGADSWRAPDGLVFVDNAKHDPVPPSAHIIEIKFGTCGDI